MKKKYLFTLFVLIISFQPVLSQNTIGTLINTANSYNAYTLFTVNKNTFLINNCGQVINEWPSENDSGKSVYLLPDGSLLRAEKIDNANVTIPGIGGKVTIHDWDNNLIWEYVFSDFKISQHHDVYPLPNGNILVLIVERKTQTESVLAGRNPANLPDNELYNEKILEIQPVGTNDINIVWEWNIWDHLIQDFDMSKNNFGNILDNPQLLDINFLGISIGAANWIHANSIQFNEDLNQIILSSRQLSEFYIIDHSTTTSESASHSGGFRGKGGDFLYRWGNPITYRAGDLADQKLFGQHFPHWIPSDFNDGDKIMIFNNGFGRPEGFSSVEILTPPQDQNGNYIIPIGDKIGPVDFDWTYTDPIDPTKFFSKILSSAQRLPNGNTLICEGIKGAFFEIDSNEEIVWKYINPMAFDGPLTQGEPNQELQNLFRAFKYSTDYSAFNGKDLTPGDPIELDFDLSNCEILASPDVVDQSQFVIPNPVNNRLVINTNYFIEKVEVYNIQGKKIIVENRKKNINFTSYSSGIYFVKIYTDKGIVNKKIIKI